MYHPYFRGKQYELISIREMASTLKEANFHPIIEPVRESLSGLNKALTAIVEVEGKATVIVNPHHGDLSETTDALTALLRDNFLESPYISAGILLTPGTTLAEALACHQQHINHSPVFVHAGFTDAKNLADQLGNFTKENHHVFLDGFSGKLYQKHFKGAHRVLIKDGFKKQKNKDYPLMESFSDLHATFSDEGMDGFGDFLIVGDEYSETGGPAYAIAIHLTFIDDDEEMKIYHFVSERKDTPLDPAGKFQEALNNMMNVLDAPGSTVIESSAVEEFRKLHAEGHFPGLGYVKKLSMNHHIETLADYFNKD